MENYKITLPFNGEEEKQMLIEFAQKTEGVEIKFDNQKNLLGGTFAEIIMNVDPDKLLSYAGSLASLYAVFGPKKVDIFDTLNNKNVKRNISFKEIISWFQKNSK